MKLQFSDADERFRREIAGWLADNLVGEFAPLRFRGGPGDEHMFPEERKHWERRMAEGGWTCIGWPTEFGGRAASIEQQVIFHEEYARAGGPGRMGHIGEGLAGPTIIAFGTDEQKARLLPGIRAGTELRCAHLHTGANAPCTQFVRRRSPLPIRRQKLAAAATARAARAACSPG